MSEEIKAYAAEYGELSSEMDALHESIAAAFSDINAKLSRMVSPSGPFHSKETSKKVGALLELLRQDLHVSNETVTALLDTYLCGFTSGLDEYDKVS